MTQLSSWVVNIWFGPVLSATMFSKKKDQKLFSSRNSMEPEEDNKCVDIIKKYFIETSIHGLKYIFEGGRHFFERLFWCIAVLTLWCCAIALIYQVSFSFKNDFPRGNYIRLFRSSINGKPVLFWYLLIPKSHPSTKSPFPHSQFAT